MPTTPTLFRLTIAFLLLAGCNGPTAGADVAQPMADVAQPNTDVATPGLDASAEDAPSADVATVPDNVVAPDQQDPPDTPAEDVSTTPTILGAWRGGTCGLNTYEVTFSGTATSGTVTVLNVQTSSSDSCITHLRGTGTFTLTGAALSTRLTSGTRRVTMCSSASPETEVPASELGGLDLSTNVEITADALAVQSICGGMHINFTR
jgi:hypothetical protein